MAEEDDRDESHIQASQEVRPRDGSNNGSTDLMQQGKENSIADMANAPPMKFPLYLLHHGPVFEHLLDTATEQCQAAEAALMYLDNELTLARLRVNNPQVPQLQARRNTMANCLEMLSVRQQQAQMAHKRFLLETEKDHLAQMQSQLVAVQNRMADQRSVHAQMAATDFNLREATYVADAADHAVHTAKADVQGQRVAALRDLRLQEQRQQAAAEEEHRLAAEADRETAAQAAAAETERQNAKRRKIDKLQNKLRKLEAGEDTDPDGSDIGDEDGRTDDIRGIPRPRTYMDAATNNRTNTTQRPEASFHTKELVKVPLPQTYSGDPNDDVDEVLFTFENYLVGNGISRTRWPVHAMQLLKGKALQAYISFAQPLHKQGIVPTWDQFTDVIRGAFITHDRQLEARTQLLMITQTGSVTTYLQTFRILVSKSGAPSPTDRDLLLLYWKGLKQWVRDEAKVDPTTGEFWTSFEDLARHTITISRQKDLTSPSSNRTRHPYHKPRPSPFKINQTKLKTTPHTQGDRRNPGRGTGGSYRGGRGGRGHKFGVRSISRPHSGGSNHSHDSNKENKGYTRYCGGTCSDNKPCGGKEKNFGKNDYDHRDRSCSYFNGKPKGNIRT